MKILTFADAVGRGGVTRVVEVLSSAFARQGLDMTILGQRFNETGHPIAWEPSFPFIQVRPVDKLPLHPHQFDFLLRSAQVRVDHLRELQDDFDLIYVATPWWGMGAADRWDITKPVVADIPDLAFDHIDMGSFLTKHFRAAARRVAERCNPPVFAADYQKQWGEEHYGFTHAVRLRHSMDFSPSNDGEAVAPGLPPQYLLAFHCMGHKDPETIIRGYHLARKDYPIPLVLAGIGTDALLERRPTGQAEYILNIIRHFNFVIGRDIFILGRVDEAAIPNLYRNATLSLVASRSEGDLSGTVHESVRYGTPLVYGSLEVFTEQLVNGEHGWMFELGSGFDLARAIREAVRNPQEAKRRAINAYALLSKRTVDDVARDYIRVFQETIERCKLKTTI